MPTQSHSQDPRWRMRWITLIAFLIILLCSFIASIILAYKTKSPIPLAVPGPLLIAMRPMIRYLFGR